MKKSVKIILVSVLGLVVLLAITLIFIRYALPKVADAKDIKIEGSLAQVQRGRYLAVNVCNCIDCHSTRDYTKFAAPVLLGSEGKGGEAFEGPGIFYSKNITPFNLGNWSDGEIYRLLTTGVRKNGEPVFPIMPYPSYAKMSPEDLKSIIAYLRTLKPIENRVPESHADFPVNFIMRTFPKDVTNQVIVPDSANEVDYGKYLINAAACSDCHTPMERGEFIMDRYLSGGRDFSLPGIGIVRSMNITPDKETGIGSWSKEVFIKRFKDPAQPHNQGAKVAKGQFNTVMPWVNYSQMTDKDLGAMYTYIMSIKPIPNKVEKFQPLSVNK